MKPLETVAKNWLDVYHDNSKSASDEDISELLADTRRILGGPEELAWRFIEYLATSLRTEMQIANFSCGPLEEFLCLYAKDVCRLKHLVENVEGFSEMLSLVDVSRAKNPAILNTLSQFKKYDSR